MKTWIVDAAHQRSSPNIYPEGTHNVDSVQLIVCHFTAGDFEGSLQTLTNPAGSVSAHFLVDRDGEVYQLAALEDRCWHAGGPTSQWEGQRNVNGRSIGIETVNWGEVTRGPGGPWKTWSGKVLPPASVMQDPIAESRGWEIYPEVQLKAIEGLITRLAEIYPMFKTAPEHRIVGHTDVDPTRKVDPGAAWPWARIRKAAQGISQVVAQVPAVPSQDVSDDRQQEESGDAHQDVSQDIHPDVGDDPAEEPGFLQNLLKKAEDLI